jgi:hypothetical protein
VLNITFVICKLIFQACKITTSSKYSVNFNVKDCDVSKVTNLLGVLAFSTAFLNTVL